MSESLLSHTVTCRIPIDKNGTLCGKQFQMGVPDAGKSVEERQADYIKNIFEKHIMRKHPEAADMIIQSGIVYMFFVLATGCLEVTDPELLKRRSDIRMHIMRSCALALPDEAIEQKVRALNLNGGSEQVVALVKEVRDVLMGISPPPAQST